MNYEKVSSGEGPEVFAREKDLSLKDVRSAAVYRVLAIYGVVS